MALQRKTFKHNPAARINDTTGMVDLRLGSETFDLDPEQAAFIGEQLRYLSGIAKSRHPALGYKTVVEEDEPRRLTIDELEAQDGLGDGSWAIPQETA